MTQPAAAGCGTLHLVGVGPGDPELITVRGARLCQAARHLAYFAKRGEAGHARRTAAPYLAAPAEIRLEFPYTTERPSTDPLYREALRTFYAEAAARIGAVLAAGEDVVLLCEGDPFFYGSGLHLIERIAPRFPIAVTPGISSVSAAAARLAAPLVRGGDVFTVLPALLPDAALRTHLRQADALAILKLGRHLPRLRALLAEEGLLSRTFYAERITHAAERLLPLADCPPEMSAPYFSLLLIRPPGEAE
jgi:precorrin-2/cobalt-factor-2 C20-methyltransferase